MQALKRLLLILMLIFPFIAHAQVGSSQVGITIGDANYSGDMQVKRYTFQQSHLAFGVFYKNYISPKVAFRAGLTLAKVSAADAKSKDSALILRNLSFSSSITEFHVGLEYNFFDLSQKKFTPYIFGGLAVFHFNPTAIDTAGLRVDLQPLSTEGEGLPGSDKKVYSRTQFAIPLGAGIKYAINDDITLGLELGLRKTFTDYLDDVSTNYVSQKALLDAKGPLAVKMAWRKNELPGYEDASYPKNGSNRGSSKYQDWYYFTTFTIAFKLVTHPHKFHGSSNAIDEMKCPTY